MSEPVNEEAPPTFMFAIALTVIAALLMTASSLRLLGVWSIDTITVLLLRAAVLVVLLIGIRMLIGKEAQSVRTVLIGLGALWISALLEGLLMWGDIDWFFRRLVDEAAFGALAGALLLSIPVAILLHVRPTQEHLSGPKS